MAYSFSSDWAQEVADISTLPEFQTARVRIEDWSGVVTERDLETNELVIISGDPVIYEGRARVIGVNRGAFHSGEGQANATTLVAVRVQLPREDANGNPTADLRVRKGAILYVTEAPRQPVLTEYVYTATTDFQGASSAARTLEFSVDLDSAVANG